MLMLEQQRDVLQVPDDVCYLNTSYMGPQLRTVVDAGKAAIDWRSRPWEITAADFFDTVEEVRAGFADLIHPRVHRPGACRQLWHRHCSGRSPVRPWRVDPAAGK
jgi:hypothetical protein